MKPVGFFLSAIKWSSFQNTIMYFDFVRQVQQNETAL
jgi:hypothetical protein